MVFGYQNINKQMSEYDEGVALDEPTERQQRPKKIPVPTQYREASKILKQVIEEGKSLKDLVYNNKHCVSRFDAL